MPFKVINANEWFFSNRRQCFGKAESNKQRARQSWFVGNGKKINIFKRNASFGNCLGSNGVYVFDGSSFIQVITKTWDNDWHTIRIDVHNGQTDADIYIDDEESPSATDSDCSFVTTTDGRVQVLGEGSVAGNGEYHIDYIKINNGICTPESLVDNWTSAQIATDNAKVSGSADLTDFPALILDVGDATNVLADAV